MFGNKFAHMRTFPLTHEISTYGVCRKRGSGGFKYFSQIDEPEGTYVYIPVKDNLQKCLVAELILLSFMPNYRLGDEIKYKDGNIHNIRLDNLRHRRRKKLFDSMPGMVDRRLIGLWRCDSRAHAANARTAARGAIITPDDVIRCLTVCGFKCFYCEKAINPHSWHLDHYMPLSKGGRNEFNNLRASCKYCNTMKSDLDYVQWVSMMHKVLHVFLKHNPDHIFSNDIKGFAKLVQTYSDIAGFKNKCEGY